MGEQRNLTQENVKELTGVLDKMKETNKELEYRFFNQNEEQTEPDAPDMITLLKEIKNKVDALERKVSIIFDGHVLINGSFVQIKT